MTQASPASRRLVHLAWMLAVTLTPALLPGSTSADPGGVTAAPQHGSVPATAGNGNEVTAVAPSGTIASATGSFDEVTNVLNESSPVGSAGTVKSNAYTLQLNTNYFTSAACLGTATCQGWQQFLYLSDGTQGTLAIRQWLVRFNGASCPNGWNTFSFSGSSDVHCWRDAVSLLVGNAQPITNLAQLQLTGTVSAGGSDTVSLAVGTAVTTATASIPGIGAAAGWTAAEFNVLGADGSATGGYQASFNPESILVTRIRIDYGGRAAPNCLVQGFTAETNSLAFVAAPAATPPGPALIFKQANVGALASCTLATSIGDTHLMTLGGTFYDFQASGDFVLLERQEGGFEVQARQVSGAPTWPDASINKGVAARLGKDRVAICLPPVGLAVDGKRTALGDGKTLHLPGGGQVTRQGNVYLLRGPAGDSVRAEVVNPYINVTVGLGRWPDAVRGVLVNPKDDPTAVAARDGAVLKAPFTAAALYGHFADSWRVGGASLLAPCGKAVKGAPRPKPFYAKDLKPKARERALAACRKAGVKEPTLLDACVLDVTVIGKASAAKVFATHRAPVVVGDAPQRGHGGKGGGDKDDGKDEGKEKK